MRVAVVGGGISGLCAAWMLAKQHDVTLFDQGPWLGGHTHTVDVTHNEETWAVDTGFIVFNDRTYPNFLEFLDRLGVGRQNSEMSFSVTCEQTGIEYNGSTLLSLFARPANAVSPRFLLMLRDIVRFNRSVQTAHNENSLSYTQTLSEYLDAGRYGVWMREKYIGPMVAAIWSSSVEQAMAMPIGFFARFFANHGLLDLTNRPQWYVVPGGSKIYVEMVQKQLGDRVRTSERIVSIRRETDGVSLKTAAGDQFEADHVVIATHSDDALSLLDDPTGRERDILGAIGYQENHVVLHTDSRLLPHRRAARASWNCRLSASNDAPDQATLTYYMNRLQGITAPVDWCVTLNAAEGVIASASVHGEWHYRHPVFDAAALGAAARRDEISGLNRTSYCGAYWHNGFHEDGVVSAIAAVKPFGVGL